jgi:hypothetical protein
VVIWLAAFVAPLVVPVALVILGVMWFRRKRARRIMHGESPREPSL